MAHPISKIQVTKLQPKPGPQAHAFYVDGDDGRIHSFKLGDTKQYNVPRECVKVITADTTLTAADDGMTIVFNSSTSLVVTLPATAKNLKFNFYVQTAAGSGVGHSISPASVDKIFCSGFTAADNKDAINTQATAAVGDAFSLIGDGADGWYGIKTAGTWARE